MRIHRLNTILKKSSNSKYEKNFEKYLSSLDFEEYRDLFGGYLVVFTRLMIRYRSKKKTIKNWFNNHLLKAKYYKFIGIFMNGNRVLFDRYNNELQEINKGTTNLIIDIEKAKISLQNLRASWLIWSDSLLKFNDVSRENMIFFNILLISIIHHNKEYERLVIELDELTKKYKQLL